jgi:hypothetical protein
MRNVFRLSVAALVLMGPSAVLAQTQVILAGPTIVAPEAGDCIVRIENADATLAGVDIEIDLNKQPIGRQRTNGRQRLEFWIPGPLEQGDLLRSRYVTMNGRGTWSGPVVVAAAAGGDPECKATAQADVSTDPRDPIDATAYVGGAIDNFAPAIVANYKVKEEHSRVIGGVNFDFRVWPYRNARKDSMQIWITGETLHGVRTADIDCSGDEKPQVCGEAPDVAVGQRFRFALKHASSFEAFVQPRIEFLTIEADSPFATRLYATGRFGIMMLTEGDGYAAEAHHFGLGLGAIGGRFEGSFLEVGWGKTELFAPVSGSGWNRLKFDGLLSVPVLQGILERARFWETQPRLFIQLYADFDPGGRAADSVQTFIGVDIPIGDILR